VAYLDGDLTGLQPGLLARLLEPLAAGDADFVKARFGRGGGRVTELTAKPMLRVFFPELAHFGQPLGGIVAARRSLLTQLRFEDGYGVDIGLLLDAWRAGARLAEVDIGRIEHDSQPLHDLTSMANEVARVIYSRARDLGRLSVDQVVAMYEQQRQAAASLQSVLTRRRGRTRMLLLAMDGTLTVGRFVVELARRCGQSEALAERVDGPAGEAADDVADDAAGRSERIAALFRFIHQSRFEEVAASLPLRPGAVAWVNAMRRAGFMVGVVSDSWFVAAEIVRRRVFADFALAHLLHFDQGICSGRRLVNPAFVAEPGAAGPAIDKAHVLRRIREEAGELALQAIWAVGDGVNDLRMLQAADRAFAIDPRSPVLAGEPRIQVVDSFDALMREVPPTRSAA
jgi:phosphoserine phosphatase